MKEDFIFRGLTISYDPIYLYNKLEYTNELKVLLKELYEECIDLKNKKIFIKIKAAIENHPQIPQLKSYLSKAYAIRGELKKASETNDWVLKEHPDYLFAKINKANDFLTNKELDKIPGLFGENLDLNALYPDRNIFHINEILSFHKVLFQYYTEIKDLDSAELSLNVFKELDPDSFATEDAEAYLFSLRMLKDEEQWKGGNYKYLIPENFKEIPESDITEPPLFNHPEINQLYEFKCDIPQEILEEIMSLPRATLIEDLEKLLIDAVDRYHYFVKEDLSFDNTTFIIHAIYLLTEINATESLDKILSFNEYDPEFLEFWLGDFTTEKLWQCYFKLGIDQTAILKHFLLKPSVDTYSKSAVSNALTQILLHHPDKKEEIYKVYYDVLNAFLNADEDTNLIDSDFLGFVFGDIIECNLIELLPLIKLLFEKGYVNDDITGDYKMIEQDFNKPKIRNYKLETESIFEIYDYVAENWYDDFDYNEEFEADDDNLENTLDDGFDVDFYIDADKGSVSRNEPKELQQAVSTKTGRNEPCPCGSGKKYKKCCMDK